MGLGRRVVPVVGLFLFLLLPHCRSSYAGLCERQKDCEGGNDKDVEACIEGARGQEEVASAYGCSDLFDRWIDCTDAKATCKDKRFESGACKAEGDALLACQKAASGRK
ncbi:MAG TPA: hypothetical protein VM580_06275 [Labilithrix sp.]|nr:hypothetical protein [Labilithrix sp.]